MTQQPQKPRRTALRPNTQQGYSQPAQPAFQQPTPSAPQQNMPQPAPERIVIVQKSGGNPVAGFFNLITLPFRKGFAAILWLVRVIIAAMLRSVISFIVGIIMMILLSVFVSVYGFALVDSNMDAIQALSLSFERIIYFVQNFASFQQTAENMQNAIPTGIPGNP
jgi:hypothetical protein